MRADLGYVGVVESLCAVMNEARSPSRADSVPSKRRGTVEPRRLLWRSSAWSPSSRTGRAPPFGSSRMLGGRHGHRYHQASRL